MKLLSFPKDLYTTSTFSYLSLQKFSEQTRDGINMSFCVQNKCAHCCISEDVPLLAEDINKITAMGYYDVYFVVNYKGMKVMRKLDGKCIFFQDGVCEIEHNRPSRCQFYPMTYDGDNECAAISDECRFKNRYEITKSGNEEMVKYIERLKHEFELRTREPNQSDTRINNNSKPSLYRSK